MPLHRRFNAISVQQASEDSPTLAGLMARVRDAQERLRAVQELIPPDMRPAVQSGPVDEDGWCLLVQGNAAAAKLRHLLPRLQMRLKNKGWTQTAIRIKVRSRGA